MSLIIPSSRFSRTLICSFVIFLSFLFLLPSKISGQGNLLITPRRVVFDGSTRSIDLNLEYTGRDSATYAISLVQIRMTEDGGFETITEPDPGQRFADKFIRFFPRSVTLGPNEAQVVKVQVTRRSQLEEGEYRSHFYFRAEKAPSPLGEEDPAKETNTISVKLTPVFGITIPVIIRIGKPEAIVTLEDLKFGVDDENNPVLDISFKRSGEKSIYGNLVVEHISPAGVSNRVAIVNGIAVYTPNNLRKFRLKLLKSGEIDYSSGKLKLLYTAPSDLDPETFAEAELILQ